MSTGTMVPEGECDEDLNCSHVGTSNDPVKNGPVTTRCEAKWISPDERYLDIAARP